MDFSANYIMWQDIKLLVLLLIVPKNLMDYVTSAMHHRILPESPIYSVDIIVLYFFALLHCFWISVTLNFSASVLFCFFFFWSCSKKAEAVCKKRE